MIKTKNLVPDIYYDHSRDFQLIGRLYELIFNYIKTNSDTIYNIPSASTINSEELELLAYTLGFKSKHDYPISQLRAVCSCMSEILRNKGTNQSILSALNACLRAENILEQPTLRKEKDDEGNYTGGLELFVPSSLKDLNLFEDLLDYILPAGVSVSIIKHSLLEGIGKVSNTNTVDIQASVYKESYMTSFVPTFEQGEDIIQSDIEGGRHDNTVVVPYDENADYNRISPEAPEPITDLTGTTWLINESLNIEGGEFYGSLDFTSNDTSYNLLSIGWLDWGNDLVSDYIEYLWDRGGSDYGDNTAYNSTWTDSNYRIISITGGSLATNSGLIAWLEENATQL